MKRFGWILACALLIGAGSRAVAQDNTASILNNNWELRGGFFIPERAGARQAEGDVWFTAGGEHTFYFQSRYRGTISIDYYGSGRIYNIPIELNARGETNRLRYGVGAGISVGHDSERGRSNFAYNLLIGYTIQQGRNPVFADIRYLGTGASKDLRGWAFTLGVGF